MKNSMGATQETGFKASQKKHRRSRKPKFEIGKSKRVYDKKKKDKERSQVVTTEIAERRLEEISAMFSEIRKANRQLKERISEIDAYIFDKLAAWDAGDN